MLKPLTFFFLCPVPSLPHPTHSPLKHTYAHTHKCVPSFQADQPIMKLSQKISVRSNFSSLKPNLKRPSPKNGDDYDAQHRNKSKEAQRIPLLPERTSLDSIQTGVAVLLGGGLVNTVPSFRPDCKTRKTATISLPHTCKATTHPTSPTSH